MLQTSGSLDRGKSHGNAMAADENEMICELKFGSYCLWRREQREKMEDSVVKRMKDLLFVARAYYPSIAKLPKFDKLSQEMKQNIQDFERVLSEATTDKDLPPQYVEMQRFNLLIYPVYSLFKYSVVWFRRSWKQLFPFLYLHPQLLSSLFWAALRFK